MAIKECTRCGEGSAVQDGLCQSCIWAGEDLCIDCGEPLDGEDPELCERCREIEDRETWADMEYDRIKEEGLGI